MKGSSQSPRPAVPQPVLQEAGALELFVVNEGVDNRDEDARHERCKGPGCTLTAFGDQPTPRPVT